MKEPRISDSGMAQGQERVQINIGDLDGGTPYTERERVQVITRGEDSETPKELERAITRGDDDIFTNRARRENRSLRTRQCDLRQRLRLR